MAPGPQGDRARATKVESERSGAHLPMLSLQNLDKFVCGEGTNMGGGEAAEEKKQGCGETQLSCNQMERLNGIVSVSFYGLADLKGGH